MIGRTLSHHRIIAALGAGGMGEVYLAEDIRLGRRVALKVLPKELAGDPRRLERLEREARALATLDHPNIVTLFSVEEAGGVHFLTMAYVKGETLAEIIPVRGLPSERLLEFARPLIDAVRAAHEHGIVHRDLKPSNVMVDGEGRLRVLDFGLAKVRAAEDAADLSQLPTEAMTQEGAVLGTYPYMSPEQVEGKPADERSDVFALGVMLYEMATGERPFRGDTSASLVAAILKETPPAVDEVRDDLPHHLGRVIQRCLEKDPERRYQRAKHLLHDLEELDGEGILHDALSAPRSATLVTRSRKPLYAVFGAVAVAAIGLWVSTLRPTPPVEPVASPIRSIAVLPLTNLMNDPEQEYFVDGMTEALIANIAKLGGLKVISRTSVMRYKGVDKSAPEIARELDVDALLEGSVARADDRVRISAQLIDGRADEHLWVKTYDRDLTDVLALFSEVARAVAAEIELQLTPEEEELLAPTRPVVPEAYEAYLRGRYHLYKFTPEGIERAFEYFHQALEIDPDSALGHAGLADAYINVGFLGLSPARETTPAAKEAVQRALELDDKLAAAHFLSGWIKLNYDWDWPGAEREFLRALELGPNEVQAHWSYSAYLATLGRFDEALATARRAEALDPLSPLATIGVAIQLYYLCRWDEAIEQSRRTLELNPEDPFAHGVIGLSLYMQGKVEQAVQELARSFTLFGNQEVADALLSGYEQDGEKGAFLEAAETGAAQFELAFAPPLDMAGFYAHAGELDLAYEWLETAYEMRDPFMATLGVDPNYEPLRADPRFEEMARRIGLPEIR